MPDPQPPLPLDYAPGEERRGPKLVLGILVGSLGYLGLLAGTFILMSLAAPTPHTSAARFSYVAGLLLLPFLFMLAVSFFAKSKPMMITTIITFATVALGCGACSVLFVF